jgi:hypothetical protein
MGACNALGRKILNLPAVVADTSSGDAQCGSSRDESANFCSNHKDGDDRSALAPVRAELASPAGAPHLCNAKITVVRRGRSSYSAANR